MDSSRRKASTQQGLIILMGFIILAAGAWLLVWPKWQEINSSKEALQFAQEKASNKQATVADLDGLISDYESKKKQLALLDEALPATPEIPQLLANLESLVKQTGMTITSLHFSKVQKKAENSAATTPATSAPSFSALRSKNLEKTEINLAVNGSFDSFALLLDLLEKNLRLFEINTLSSTEISDPASKGVSVQRFEMVMKTFYQD